MMCSAALLPSVLSRLHAVVHFCGALSLTITHCSPALFSPVNQFSPKRCSSNPCVSLTNNTELNKGGPKKLSEVKVNPAIAAALGGLNTKQSSSSSRPGSNNPTGASMLISSVHLVPEFQARMLGTLLCLCPPFGFHAGHAHSLSYTEKEHASLGVCLFSNT